MAGLNIFSREERAAAKRKIAELVSRDPISKAVSDAIIDVAAATAAIIAVSAAGG